MDWSVLFSASLVILSLTHVANSAGEDTIIPGKLILTNQTLISISQTFALGFFDTGNSTHRRFYLGIWYYKIPDGTIVWVANRNESLSDPAGGATIDDDGNLAVVDGNSTVIWSSGIKSTGPTNATLEDSGNFVLRDGEGRVLWQSFDFPSDTYLPGMILGLNLKTGKTSGLVSWRGPNDPSPGEYAVELDPLWPAQLLMTRGAARRWRSTWWNDQIFSEVMAANGVTAYATYLTVVNEGDEMALSITVSDSSLVWRFQLNRSGIVEHRTWLPEAGVWDLVWNRPKIPCHLYAHCGPNGVCDRNRSPECKCLIGFQPKSEAEWKNGNWSAGCERQRSLECGEGDRFLALELVKLPDFPISMENLSAEECADQCLRNCSCTAYSFANLSFGPSPRCLTWTGKLMDLEQNYTTGQDLHIRLAHSELDKLNSGGSKRSKHLVVITVLAVCGGMLVCSVLVYFLWNRSRSRGRAKSLMRFDTSLVGEDLPLINFTNIQTATENFSTANKLGEGRFGSVYKGKLPEGQEIAVKRLSQNSKQGLEEFKNEVQLIAKLQHQNLVRLLGWCICKKEKLLIYEFMPNESLDKYLFEPSLQSQLDWGKRFHIADGIAQGILYLHQHSRLKIIHRDLKINNILLDGEMNPKISNFGLARIVKRNQSEANTKRVVGNYGYLSPEYAMDESFSEKSDVFSFGVILLELVSGKRSSDFLLFEHNYNLLGYAWLLWREDRCLELIDPFISKSCKAQEVARCIHIALLCVQEDAADRPRMSSVVMMLSSENSSLHLPKGPAISVGKDFASSNSSSLNSSMNISENNRTVQTGGSNV